MHNATINYFGGKLDWYNLEYAYRTRKAIWMPLATECTSLTVADRFSTATTLGHELLHVVIPNKTKIIETLERRAYWSSETDYAVCSFHFLMQWLHKWCQRSCTCRLQASYTVRLRIHLVQPWLKVKSLFFLQACHTGAVELQGWRQTDKQISSNYS